MLIKGHKFGQKKKRQKVKRKQRRKDVQHDRLQIKKGVGVNAKSRKSFNAPKKAATPPRKKKQKNKPSDERIQLSDENLKEVMGRYRKDKIDNG